MIGPNGAGKTTLLSILAGIRSPDAGTVAAPGEVGWVPQQAALYRRLTVAENLRLFARLEQVDDVEATVERMLEQTGLGERRDDQVGTLSGGNQQRVNIAIGLLVRARGAAPRRALHRPRPAPARAPLGVRPRPRRRRDDGDLLDPLHPGGRALRRPPARARRRRGASSTAPPTSCTRRSRRPAQRDFEEAFVAFLRERGHWDRLMRWLLLKDLQILRRSPLVTALLVVYPIVIAVLIGFALSGEQLEARGSPSSTRSRRTQQFELGGDEEEFDAAIARERALRPGRVRRRLTRARRPSRRSSDGEVLAALILPADLIDKLQLARRPQPGAADRRGPRQRGRPGQGAARRRPDPGADHRGEPDPLASRSPSRPRATSTS